MTSSQTKLPSLQRLPLEKVPHAIDFIGTGTFQVSQLDVLQKRSIELIKTTESNLSARGLHHRSKDYFTKDVRASTAVIQQALLQGVRDPKNNSKSSVYLKSQYFQRALGFERLGEIDRAIEDYGRCIVIDPQCAVAYFNRGGLYYSQGKLELATLDYDKAIELEPSKQIYHTNRALIYRRRGLFTEATSDTLVSKNISNSHHLRSSATAATASAAIRIELKKQISIITHDEDPVVTFLKKPFLEREESGDIRCVIEFLKSVKFFHGIASEPMVMKNCAKKVRLKRYEKDHTIFNEGDPGKSFFVILDGEVSIVKMMRLLDSEKTKTEVLVKLFRGQTFGETALDNESGVRTAGAVASQATHLLVMDVEDYKRIFASYRLQLRNDIREVLSTCTVFTSWDNHLLDSLADHAVVQTFSAGTVLLSHGNPVSKLFIIKRGVVKILKNVIKPPVTNIQIDEFATPDSINGMEAPGLWVLTKNWKDRLRIPDDQREAHGAETGGGAGSGKEEESSNSITITVGVLGSGQVFGELAILSPETPSPTSVVSFTSLEVYTFDSEYLLSLGARFNTASMNILNESLNLYNPPIDKIAHYYRSKFNWENRKKKILKDMIRERPTIAGKFDINR